MNKELLTELRCRKEVQGGVEASSGHVVPKRHCLYVLGWRSKSQSRVRVSTQNRCQRQEDKLIEINW